MRKLSRVYDLVRAWQINWLIKQFWFVSFFKFALCDCAFRSGKTSKNCRFQGVSNLQSRSLNLKQNFCCTFVLDERCQPCNKRRSSIFFACQLSMWFSCSLFYFCSLVPSILVTKQHFRTAMKELWQQFSQKSHRPTVLSIAARFLAQNWFLLACNACPCHIAFSFSCQYPGWVIFFVGTNSGLVFVLPIAFAPLFA